jgi:hypothetical protein
MRGEDGASDGGRWRTDRVPERTTGPRPACPAVARRCSRCSRTLLGPTKSPHLCFELAVRIINAVSFHIRDPQLPRARRGGAEPRSRPRRGSGRLPRALQSLQAARSSPTTTPRVRHHRPGRARRGRPPAPRRSRRRTLVGSSFSDPLHDEPIQNEALDVQLVRLHAEHSMRALQVRRVRKGILS